MLLVEEAWFPHVGQVYLPTASWTVTNLTLQTWVRFPAEGFQLTATRDVTVKGATRSWSWAAGPA